MSTDRFRRAERIAAILADPEVQRIGALIQDEETRAGQELHAELQVLQDRYETAVRTGDLTVLTQVCGGGSTAGGGASAYRTPATRPALRTGAPLPTAHRSPGSAAHPTTTDPTHASDRRGRMQVARAATGTRGPGRTLGTRTSPVHPYGTS